MTIPKDTRLGHYRIGSHMATEGLHEAYEAIDERYDRRVVLKISRIHAFRPPEKSRQGAFRDEEERFKNEGDTAAGFNHPNIVPVYDVGEYDGTPFYIAAYPYGGTLSQGLDQGSIAVPQTLEVAKDICRALEYIHGRGLVHRDVKPSNVWFDATRSTMLSGYTREVVTSDLDRITGWYAGTEHYMSPEQIRGGSDIDGRSDLYNLGITIYEMLTGTKPFDDKTPIEVLKMHIREPVPSLPSRHRQCQYLIDKLLAKNPDARFPSASACMDEIESLLGTFQSESPAPGTRPLEEKTRASTRTSDSDHQVFISFKNLDANGRQTRDSQLARTLYDYLTARGFKVFLSSVSLEKMGASAYQQAIDRALDAAMVVVAVGTSREHLESRWVESEWSGFINDIRSGLKPAGHVFSYIDGMEPRDLPRSLRQYQMFKHSDESLMALANFIENALDAEGD
ncbi:protein kinase [bacterium]|nr:protein kinase [bacterium]